MAARLTARYPINMPLWASTGPVLGRWCQHRTSTDPVLATNSILQGYHMKSCANVLVYQCSPRALD